MSSYEMVLHTLHNGLRKTVQLFYVVSVLC